VIACHDVSDGGLLVAVAEMALGGNLGVKLSPAPISLAAHGYWFGEDQARYILGVDDPAQLQQDAAKAGVPAQIIGVAGGTDLSLSESETISVAELRGAHAAFFANWFDV